MRSWNQVKPKGGIYGLVRHTLLPLVDSRLEAGGGEIREVSVYSASQSKQRGIVVNET